ncbi:MAG TPA: hypothetical protein VFZ75_03185 [Actinomycetota bacterium]|nr:hypothetical protein [Actinomycetota bacterium]
MSSVLITTAPRSVGDAMACRLRETSVLVVACGLAGALVGGIGSRLVMRPITLEGTIGLVLLAGVGSAILGAGAFTLLRPWLPTGTVVRGLVFGGILLALLGGSVVDAANVDLVLLGDRVLTVVVFSGLFVAFGLVASGTLALLDGRLRPAPALSPRSWALTLVGALPVVPGIVGVLTIVSLRHGVPCWARRRRWSSPGRSTVAVAREPRSSSGSVRPPRCSRSPG